MMQPARERPGTAAQKGIGHRMQTALMGWVHQLGTLEYWEALLAGFEGLGPLVPILLAMVESFFPPLPLIAIVALNVAAHGGLRWAASSCFCSGGGSSSAFSGR